MTYSIGTGWGEGEIDNLGPKTCSGVDLIWSHMVTSLAKARCSLPPSTDRCGIRTSDPFCDKSLIHLITSGMLTFSRHLIGDHVTFVPTVNSE